MCAKLIGALITYSSKNHNFANLVFNSDVKIQLLKSHEFPFPVTCVFSWSCEAQLPVDTRCGDVTTVTSQQGL